MGPGLCRPPAGRMTRAGRSGTMPAPGALAGRPAAGGLSSGTVDHLGRGLGGPGRPWPRFPASCARVSGVSDQGDTSRLPRAPVRRSPRPWVPRKRKGLRCGFGCQVTGPAPQRAAVVPAWEQVPARDPASQPWSSSSSRSRVLSANTHPSDLAVRDQAVSARPGVPSGVLLSRFPPRRSGVEPRRPGRLGSPRPPRSPCAFDVRLPATFSTRTSCATIHASPGDGLVNPSSTRKQDRLSW